jgi:hypothetical protein
MFWNSTSFPIGMIREAVIAKAPVGNQKTKKRRFYKNLICAFDIETTRIPDIEQSFMYIWQMQIEDQTIMGRTWPEFLQLLDRIRYELPDDVFLVIWIQNASYEFQFLRGIYHFAPDEVFAVDSRKLLRFDMYNHFEFRCSYLQTNMSLKEFTHKMGVEAEKLSGEEFNYSKFRTPTTPLTMREIEYCVNDVKGLVQALKKEMSADGDTLYTIPRTSTGYVRREAKEAMRHFNRQWLKDMLPDWDVYLLSREAFRGGNCHGNRYYAGRVLKGVHGVDESSAYPTCQTCDRVPMGRWYHWKNVSEKKFIEMVMSHRRAILARITLINPELRDHSWGCPYLARAKCRNVIAGEFDNGLILRADYLETTVTDLDMDIIVNEYEFDDIIIQECYHARYGKLPKELTDLTKKYYTDKTALKGDKDQEIYYMKQKNKLNSIYGMSVQCPTKPDVIFDDKEGFEFTDTPEPELLEKSNRTAFQSYTWGVWITANARYRLEKGIRIAGSGFVYCDTDSVKYIGDKSKEFDEYNRKQMKIAEENGAFADDRKGQRHYMGVFERESPPDGYEEFVTLGAKKYAYRENGKLHITVAGVSKTKGAEELESLSMYEKYYKFIDNDLVEFGSGINAFRPGFIFYSGGGTESIYNDHPEEDGITEYVTPEGEKIPITSNVVIRDSTYELGLTAEYRRLIEFPEIWLKATTEFR